MFFIIVVNKPISLEKRSVTWEHYQIYKRILEKRLIVTADGSNSKDALHMLAETNTTLISLFPKESVALAPQSEMHEEMSNSMGDPMTGESTPSKNSSESGSSQSSPNKAEESTSSGYTITSRLRTLKCSELVKILGISLREIYRKKSNA